MTRKIIAILTVAAMLFALPFIATADNQVDYPEQELEVAVPAPAELPSVDEPAAEDSVADEPDDEASEDVLEEEASEEDDPEEELPADEVSEEIAPTGGELEELVPSGGPIELQDIIDYLYYSLNEIRDRMELDFAYIADNYINFPGVQADLDDLLTVWNAEWAFLDAVFSDWDGYISWLMAQYSLSEDDAISMALTILFGTRDGFVDPITGEIIIRGMEYYYLDWLRDIDFDVVASCDDCIPGGPVGICECWCYNCRGHGFDDDTHDCRFCQPQLGDGYCPLPPVGCGLWWEDCTCGTLIVLCDDCGEYPCECRPATPVDRGALGAAIGAAEGRVQANYTAASWNAFIAALEAARAVYANPNATQAQIDAALAALLVAKGELVRVNQPSGERTTTVVTAMVAPQTGDATSTQAPLVKLMLSLFAISGLSLVKFRMRKQ